MAKMLHNDGKLWYHFVSKSGRARYTVRRRDDQDNSLLDFDIDGGMIGTLIMLVVCWPIGVIILLNKLKKFKRGKSEYRKLKSMGITTMIAALALGFLGGYMGWASTMLLAGGGITLFAQLDKKREKRYRRYLSIIGGRSPVSLVDISARSGEPVSTVAHDLRKMIQAGYFGLETYIDESRRCIVLDGVDSGDLNENAAADAANDRVSRLESDIRGAVNRIFDEIKHGINDTVDTIDGAKHRQGGVDLKKETRADKTAASKPQGDKTADKGKVSSNEGDESQSDQFAHYITEIRDANSRIADEEISEKIDQIESITAKIFGIVRKRPERIGEIRKFMNYYLPTTLKLLDSYALLEEQGIEGHNISASKQQIRAILDTLIKSYEKQLDQLFTTNAMDITSDIEVMETMLSADGLKESDFTLRDKAAAKGKDSAGQGQVMGGH